MPNDLDEICGNCGVWDPDAGDCIPSGMAHPENQCLATSYDTPCAFKKEMYFTPKIPLTSQKTGNVGPEVGSPEDVALGADHGA